jgi:hypothetical protein
MRSGLSTFFLAAALAACGGVDEGFSGVRLDARVGALSMAEMRDLCAWVIEAQGGEGAMYDCGNGSSVTLDTIDECVAEQGDYADCAMTVAQMESCVLDVGADPCRAPQTASCQPLGRCLSGS